MLLKRTSDEFKESKLSVLYFNSLMSVVGVCGVLFWKQDEVEAVRNFEAWGDPQFVILLVAASVMGSVLNYAIFLCTTVNSALTTTVVGCLKNVLTTYVGMVFGGDYIWSWLNFLGINVSVVGSLVYARANL